MDGRRWAVMKWFSGSRLIDHRSYRGFFQNRLYNWIPPNATPEQRAAKIQQCDDFMNAQYEAVADMNARYLATYGWATTDINWDNFLLSEDEQPIYNNVDWGLATYCDPHSEATVALINLARPDWIQALRERSYMSLRDNQNYQGICDSDRRERQKERWEHPDVVMERMQARQRKVQDETERLRKVLAAQSEGAT
ncbi:hypothetical protein FRB99_005396 [Tulasnella sp. 403]|nr:hypothetical protein FRB99_005396 [Tulasnella sp. 403]